LRRGDLPESWIAPVEVRELRELIRYRAKLAALRTPAKAQIHAVMAKLGILPSMSDMFGPTGQSLLDAMAFEGAYATRVASLRGLLERYEDELVMVEHQLHGRLAHHKGYSAIQALNGVGRITAAIMVAEIGDVGRFPDARHLCSWAGLTPTHRESDTKVHRGHITKQGSTLVRWAAIEAVARYHGGAPIAAAFTRIATRRGVMIARVARPGNCSASSSTGCATARSAASPGRPVEHGSDTATAPARRSTWPPSGEAGELSAARLAVAGTHHAPRTVGTKECPAAEPHGLPRPVLGANGEVTAVSTNPNANTNAVRRPHPIVVGDN
jgi:hypothetical protein